MRRLVIPQGLNLKEIIKEIASIEPKTSKELIRKRLMFLLSSIIYGSVIESKSIEHSYSTKKSGAHLMSTVLKIVLGGNWKRYVDLLKENNIIEVDHSYSAGYYSKKYTLTDSWFQCGLDTEIIEDVEFIKLISSAFKKKDEGQLKTKAKKPLSHQLLKGVLEKNKLQMDELKARAWINSHCDELLDKGEYKNHRQAHPEHKRFVYNAMVDAFLHHEYNIKGKFDEFGKRFHSLLTYCPSGLRQFLTWDGEQLVSLDLKNSQPYLLNVMFQKKFIGSADTFSLRKLMPELHAHLSNLKEKKVNELKLEVFPDSIREKVEYTSSLSQLTPLFIMLQNASQSQVSWGSQKVNFQSLVQNGGFYEFIQEKMQGRYLQGRAKKDRFIDRKSTKGEVLFMLYHDPRNSSKSARIKKPFIDFMKLFPVQGNLLNLIKSRNYKDAPMLLQRVESYLFLEKIATSLIKQDIPVLTIHDSIVVPIKYVYQVQQLMQKTLQQHVGEKPSIKQEFWVSN